MASIRHRTVGKRLTRTEYEVSDSHIVDNLLPETPDTVSLGSAGAEYLNGYFGDDGRLYFGLDQDFSIGSGALSGSPVTSTNTQNYIRQAHIKAVETTDPGSGFAFYALTVEALPTLAAQNYQVAGYLGAKIPKGWGANIWGLNPLITLDSGSTGNGIAIEIDLNNNQAHGIGEAVVIAGNGTYDPLYALHIQSDGTGQWKRGIYITGVDDYGLHIKSTTDNNQIWLEDAVENQIKITPADDTDAVIMYVTNAADDTTHFQLRKDGSIAFQNNVGIKWNDSGGTPRVALITDGSNHVYLDNDATGDLFFRTDTNAGAGNLQARLTLTGNVATSTATWAETVVTGARQAVEHHTSDDTLTLAESGSLHTNLGEDGAMTLTLPASATAGVRFDFAVMVAQELRVKVHAASKSIYAIGAVNTDDGGADLYIGANAVGENMTLVADGNDAWVATGMYGTWTVTQP